MISKNFNPLPIVQGEITIPIAPLIEGVILFMDACLPSFPASVKQAAPGLSNEKLLNQHLADFLNGYSDNRQYGEYIVYKFLFRKDDERADTQHRPDIGVTVWNKNLQKASQESFFQFECKRLPTPNLSKDRIECEYVTGTPKNMGAIERFKKGLHGFHIDEAGVIGYIQSETPDYWVTKITSWIEDKNEHLLEVYNGPLTSRYYSICRRDNNKDILLYHYFINLQ